jgi:hypothetical protein
MSIKCIIGYNPATTRRTVICQFEKIALFVSMGALKPASDVRVKTNQ